MSQNQVEEKQTDNRWLGKWGPIVGLIGGIVGGAAGFFVVIVEIVTGSFAIRDRITDPNLEIVGIRPIYIQGITNLVAFGEKQVWPKHGIGFVLHVRSKERAVAIGDARIEGKFYLTMNHWMPSSKSKSLDAMSDEMSRKKPYYRVSLAGWLTDSKSPIRLEPRETAYVRITFLEPVYYTWGLSTHADYLGFEDESKTPQLTRFRLHAQEFFHRMNNAPVKVDIPDELRRGLMKFQITAGSRPCAASTNSWLSVKKVSEEEWNSKDPVYLFHDQADVHAEVTASGP